MRHRALKTATVALVIASLSGTVVGVTFAAFSGATSNAGNTFQAAASFGANIQFVKNVGTASCGNTSETVTVPSGGVAAGNTLIVAVAFQNNGGFAGAVSVSDSKGNTYSEDRTADASSVVKSFVFSAHMATALASGDTITVSHPSWDSSSVAVAEYSGIAATGRVDVAGSGTGQSTSPSATVTTTNGNDLLFAAMAVQGSHPWTEAASWDTHKHLSPSCGGAWGSSGNHSAYRIVSATSSYGYQPTLGNSTRWAISLVAYKAQ